MQYRGDWLVHPTPINLGLAPINRLKRIYFLRLRIPTRKLALSAPAKSRLQRAFECLEWGVFNNLLLDKDYVATGGRENGLVSSQLDLHFDLLNFSRRVVDSFDS